VIHDARMGHFVASLPVPHVPADTRYLAAGPITIGVEYRVFDPVAEAAKLTPAEIEAAGPDALFGRDDPDQGVCLHVFATEGLAEYLRFDCFESEPHYHYIVPSEGNMLVHFDPVANGPMLDWALAALRTRLGLMLGEVGAASLAAAVGASRLAAVLDEAEAVARAALAGTSAGG
jgi:hypothetical protein